MAAELQAESILTSRQAGQLLQVDPSSIKNWVRAGRIQAHRTPGGHFRIRAADLAAFCREHDIPVPGPLRLATETHVLVVDDDPRQLKSITRLLKQYSPALTITPVDNGIDALVLVGALRPQVILLDVVMPDLDGIEVCRRLQALPRTRDTEIVIMSGRVTVDMQEEALEAGAACVLKKPLTIAKLAPVLGLEAD